MGSKIRPGLNFKQEYEKAGIVPITMAAQIIGKIQEFIFVYCHAHNLTSGPEMAAAQPEGAR